MTLSRTNPLQALIARAAAAPAETGAVAAHQRRLIGATGQIILADVSDSMAEAAGGRTKIEILREALVAAPPARLIAFSSTPIEIASAAALPAPSGGTALDLALDLAATHRPARTLVISDGQPDSEAGALAAADRLTGAIDVIFCGSDSNVEALAFLMRLARVGGGRFVSTDLRRAGPALAPAIRTMLLGGGQR